MNTKITYYGMISERLDKDSEYLDIPSDAFNVRSFITSIYPELKEMTFSIAVNQELREEINEGELVGEIAILPPFAGG